MSHPYSRNPDHIRSRQVPAPSNAAINEHLQTLLSPLIYSQQAYYRSLGTRDRILTLPLMVAAIVTLLWHCGGRCPRFMSSLGKRLVSTNQFSIWVKETQNERYEKPLGQRTANRNLWRYIYLDALILEGPNGLT